MIFAEKIRVTSLFRPGTGSTEAVIFLLTICTSSACDRSVRARGRNGGGGEHRSGNEDTYDEAKLLEG